MQRGGVLRTTQFGLPSARGWPLSVIGDRGASPTQTRGTAPDLGAAPFAVMFVGVVALGLELIRPFGTAPVAFDTAASVLHFERIASGRHLEAFLTTTPKPLLTVVFGLLYMASGDWRPISWATIAAFAAAIAIAASVARRLDGWAVAAFTAAGLAASRGLWSDVGLSLATAWAVLGLAVAAMAMTGRQPRYAAAGVGILCAGLARVESLVLVPTALLAISWLALSRPADRRPPRASWLVVIIPALALPVMLLHDWLLTGNPLFWTEVAARYSAAVRAPILSPGAMLMALARHGLQEVGILALAIVGIVALGRGRSRVLALGLAGICLGVAALLVLLAVRHLFLPDRYLLLIDAGLIVAAGFGAGAVFRGAALVLDRARGIPATPTARMIAGGALGIGLAVMLGWPPATLSSQVRSSIRSQARLADHFATVLPAIRAQLAAGQAVSTGGPTSVVRLNVPVVLVPRAVVDTGLSLPQVAVTQAALVDPRNGVPGIGQMLFHDRLADLGSTGLRSIEVSSPTPEGGVVVRPLAVDPAAGYWLVTIARLPLGA